MNTSNHQDNRNPQIEYVIVVYAGGKVVTIIGFGTWPEASTSFREACDHNSADWAYLIDAGAPGTVRAEFHNGEFTGL